MQFRVGAVTDVGRKRSQNQDSFMVVPESGLFVVADGMGGHKGGEIASSTSVQTITDYVKKIQAEDPTWNAETLITDALKAANLAIFKHSEKDKSLEGMGTTTTALLFKDQKLFIGHVGDSRCYFILPHAIWQATRDHSLVQEKLRAGLITRSQLKTDQMKNVITRSVGYENEVEVEIFRMDVKTGDSFLICSDGLSGLVDDTKIIEIIDTVLSKNADDLQKGAEELVAEANKNGGDDNVTSVLVQVM